MAKAHCVAQHSDLLNSPSSLFLSQWWYWQDWSILHYLCCHGTSERRRCGGHLSHHQAPSNSEATHGSNTGR